MTAPAGPATVTPVTGRTVPNLLARPSRSRRPPTTVHAVRGDDARPGATREAVCGRFLFVVEVRYAGWDALLLTRPGTLCARCRTLVESSPNT